MAAYVIDEAALERNLDTLAKASRMSRAKILLAQKAFSCAAVYPQCAEMMHGTTSSSLFEAMHARRNFKGEVHIYSPAYDPEEFAEIVETADHIVFNSPAQVRKFGAAAAAKGRKLWLRVNPEVSVATTPAYDPCRPGSRLGTTRAQLGDALPEGVDGLHFHCLCEQGVDELKKVLDGFVEKFGEFLPHVRRVNFGGGHHITREGYSLWRLAELILDFKERYHWIEVYLEPGEAVALNAGTLEARVLEIQPKGEDGVANAILDASAACHMPDVLEMPYAPRVRGAVQGVAEGMHAYRFGGPTCLAGDVIGMYSFPEPLEEGSVVEFEDMAIYTMVKNNTFNGVPLPEIRLRRKDGRVETLKTFGYEDFASRLG